jgi:Flp pilus assembly protein TadD
MRPLIVLLGIVVIASAIIGCKSGTQTASTPSSSPLWSNGNDPRRVDSRSAEPLPDPTKAQRTNMQISLAEVSEQRGNFEEAIKTYESIVEKHRTNGRLYHRLAVLHDKMGQYDDSAKYYPLALEYGANAEEVHCDFAYSLYLQNHWREAEQRFQALIATSPNMARAHSNLGLIFARSGRVNEAVHAFELAGCTPALARVNLAHVYILDGHLQMAQQEVQLAQRMDPNSLEVAQAVAIIESGQRYAAGSPPQMTSAASQPAY